MKNSFAVRKLPVTQVGFIGKRFDVEAEHRSLESYVAEGFRVVEWDGKYVCQCICAGFLGFNAHAGLLLDSRMTRIAFLAFWWVLPPETIAGQQSWMVRGPR